MSLLSGITGRTLLTKKCKCGGELSYCDSLDGEAFVLHTLPHCDWFSKAEMVDFVKLLTVEERRDLETAHESSK